MDSFKIISFIANEKVPRMSLFKRGVHSVSLTLDQLNNELTLEELIQEWFSFYVCKFSDLVAGCQVND